MVARIKQNIASANVNKHVPVSGVAPNSSWKYYDNGLSCNAFNCRVNWEAT
ncbi:leucocin A/sakacin P family class II bacteriocin [Ligilactobacillus salivarius]|uniref:leucocin A/sakacin P family class II bacteriocin n=1 Tax=Ligilactobacillus salivarius TaxID=1624 RepID=UPI00155441E9|nr:leucocin A/sakacin P family class II bacteriocin [Ligilactobacillus salivarius]